MLALEHRMMHLGRCMWPRPQVGEWLNIPPGLGWGCEYIQSVNRIYPSIRVCRAADSGVLRAAGWAALQLGFGAAGLGVGHFTLRGLGVVTDRPVASLAHPGVHLPALRLELSPEPGLMDTVANRRLVRQPDQSLLVHRIVISAFLLLLVLVAM